MMFNRTRNHANFSANRHRKSTRHELEHLFPLLVSGGVIIIDDYGYWKGCKKATDEYIQNNQIPLLLNRLDSTGRIAIKVDFK